MPECLINLDGCIGTVWPGLWEVGVLTASLEPQRDRTTGWAFLALGAAISLALWHAMRVQEEHAAHARFKIEARDRVRVIEREFASAVGALHAIEAFFAGSQFVDRTEFGRFTAPILQRQRSVSALHWAPVVPQANRASLEEAARREGYANFELLEDASPAGAGGEPQYRTADARTRYVPRKRSGLAPYLGRRRAGPIGRPNPRNCRILATVACLRRNVSTDP